MINSRYALIIVIFSSWTTSLTRVTFFLFKELMGSRKVITPKSTPVSHEYVRRLRSQLQGSCQWYGVFEARQLLQLLPEVFVVHLRYLL